MYTGGYVIRIQHPDHAIPPKNVLHKMSCLAWSGSITHGVGKTNDVIGRVSILTTLDASQSRHCVCRLLPSASLHSSYSRNTMYISQLDVAVGCLLSNQHFQLADCWLYALGVAQSRKCDAEEGLHKLQRGWVCHDPGLWEGHVGWSLNLSNIERRFAHGVTDHLQRAYVSLQVESYLKSLCFPNQYPIAITGGEW